ncbi:reverse transcriptase domain-containing protein [Tanacetum coccineum]
METKKSEALNKEPKSEGMWKLYTDKASSSDGSGAGLMLISPEGKEYTYALRFEFETTNNEVEYKALLAGLRVVEEMEIKDLVIFIDSQLVANQVKAYSKESVKEGRHTKKVGLHDLRTSNKEVLVKVLANRSINSKEVSKITVETEENWMTPIYEYLLSGLLPEDPKEARKALRRLKTLFKKYTKGSGGFNAEPRSMVVKVTKQGFYWPLMYRDVAETIQDCTQCQTYSTAARACRSYELHQNATVSNPTRMGGRPTSNPMGTQDLAKEQPKRDLVYLKLQIRGNNSKGYEPHLRKRRIRNTGKG